MLGAVTSLLKHKIYPFGFLQSSACASIAELKQAAAYCKSQDETMLLAAGGVKKKKAKLSSRNAAGKWCLYAYEPSTMPHAQLQTSAQNVISSVRTATALLDA